MSKSVHHSSELHRFYPPDGSALLSTRGPGNPVPPTPLFAVPFVLGVWCNGYYPWPIQASGSVVLLLVLGWSLVAAGLALFTAGLVTFARHNTGILLTQAATHVVTSGPYRWTRNPMYVSFLMMYAGGSLAANTLWPLLPLPLVLFVVNRVVIAREERYMRERFSIPYIVYSFKTPRWL